ncbi:MAG: hypothetical protein ACHQCH_04170 [Solirubrobacterales bacterium]
MSDFGIIVDAGGTLFAAGAALASWASVMRAQKDADERRRPSLQVAILQEGSGRASTTIAILNAGAGTATGTVCVAKVGDDCFANPVGPGFLLYQQKALFKAKMQATNDRKALVSCRDLDGTVWAWSQAGQRKRYGQNVDPQLDSEQLWIDFYGAKLDGKRVAAELSVFE